MTDASYIAVHSNGCFEWLNDCLTDLCNWYPVKMSKSTHVCFRWAATGQVGFAWANCMEPQWASSKHFLNIILSEYKTPLQTQHYHFQHFNNVTDNYYNKRIPKKVAAQPPGCSGVKGPVGKIPQSVHCRFFINLMNSRGLHSFPFNLSRIKFLVVD